jgi:hypothetical protein
MRSLDRSRIVILVTVVVLGAAIGEWYVGASERHDEISCTPTGKAIPLPGIREASGIALSRRTPGVLWSFNDSGEPLLHAVSADGRPLGAVRVTGARVKNWEAIAIARCERDSCVYVADIGDNKEHRKQITIYRVSEPRPGDRETTPAQALVAVYPDGPHDAEALFLGRDAALYIITKDKPAQVYRVAQSGNGQQPSRLEHTTTLPMERVTDADTSPDGEWIAVRSKEEVIFFRQEEFALGEHGTPIDLRPLGEPQGEGIAIESDGTVYLASEGKRGEPGSLRTMKCVFPKS